MDAILNALYDVISGPTGTRDWDRMRSLFAPDARLIPAAYPVGRLPLLRARSVDDYIAAVSPLFAARPFYEREISRRTERFGGVAHVFSTYESRRDPTDTVPFARGINSVQLFFDGQRWWIVTIYWEAERPGNPIPSDYLKPLQN